MRGRIGLVPVLDLHLSASCCHHLLMPQLLGLVHLEREKTTIKILYINVYLMIQIVVICGDTHHKELVLQSHFPSHSQRVLKERIFFLLTDSKFFPKVKANTSRGGDSAIYICAFLVKRGQLLKETIFSSFSFQS